MNNFWKRTITGVLFVAIIGGAVLWHQLSFLLIFGVINIFCLHEFYGIFKLSLFYKWMGIITGGIIWLFISMVVLGIVDKSWLYLPILLLFTAIAGELKTTEEKHFDQPALFVFGIFYISLPVFILISSAFHAGIYNYIFIIALLIFIWVNDTMAYVTGSLIGKHKFFERISPKKTWEGVAGGMLFTLGFAVVLFYIFHSTSLANWLALAVIASVFAIIGDLIESLMKRRLNIKDSGDFFPGHGGFLDRFDALLFVIPFYFLYLIYMIY